MLMCKRESYSQQSCCLGCHDGGSMLPHVQEFLQNESQPAPKSERWYAENGAGHNHAELAADRPGQCHTLLSR